MGPLRRRPRFSCTRTLLTLERTGRTARTRRGTTRMAMARRVGIRRMTRMARGRIEPLMGERFVAELGGQVIDTHPRGSPYEERLPADDPERAARCRKIGR